MRHEIITQLRFSECRFLDTAANDNVRVPASVFYAGMAFIGVVLFLVCFFAGVSLAREFIGLNGWTGL